MFAWCEGAPGLCARASSNASVLGINNGTSAGAGLSTLAAFATAGSGSTFFTGAGAEGKGIAARGSIFLAALGDAVGTVAVGTTLVAATTGSSFGAAGKVTVSGGTEWAFAAG
jgi:hypothetical protein